jgi:hypothetical protein
MCRIFHVQISVSSGLFIRYEGGQSRERHHKIAQKQSLRSQTFRLFYGVPDSSTYYHTTVCRSDNRRLFFCPIGSRYHSSSYQIRFLGRTSTGGSVSPKLSSWYTTGRAREKYAIRCTSKIRRRWRRLWNTCEMYINSHPGMHKVQCASSPILDNARFDYVSHSHLAKTS